MRTYVIGDVHGCIDELHNLVDLLKLSRSDRVVFLGDLIDKGPSPKDVVMFVYNLSKRYTVDLVLGNHEEKYLRWLRKSPEDRAKIFSNEEFERTLGDLPDAGKAFLGASSLYCKVPGGIAVHAGIPANMKQLPNLAELGSMSRKSRDFYYQMCRVRYLDEDGRFVGLADTNEHAHRYWTYFYDGRFGNVYYGHQHFSDVSVHNRTYGIDLGCVYGGELCAAVLSEDNVEPQFIRVKCLH